MTPDECAKALGTPVSQFGTKWMFDADTYAEASELGFGIFDFYLCGRAGGVPGITADTAYDEMGIFDHGLVEENWEAGESRQPLTRTAGMWADACAEAGRRRFAGADRDDLTRAIELVGRVVAEADGTDAPIFAAWRELPVPSDPEAALAHQLNSLRELRGAVHQRALRNAKVPVVDAVLYRAGPDMAALFGHQPPYPEVTDDLKVRWRAAEAATNDTVATAFEALDDAERQELVDLLTQLLG